MKLLYMLFTLLSESRYPVPELPNSSSQELVSTEIPSTDGLQNFITLKNIRNGYDERYNEQSELNETDMQIRMSLLFYYHNQYNFLIKYHSLSLEEVQNNHIVNEILEIRELSRFRMSAGGLFDDWNR